jgi:hypothetical protein
MIRYLIACVFAGLLFTEAYAQFSSVSGPSFNVSNMPTTTVAALPACVAGNNGIVYRVTDALAPTVLGIVVGGGAIVTLVHCNGTNFLAG